MGTARAANLLTVKAIEKAKPKPLDYYLRDGAGLFVRVYPSGRKAFVYRFEVEGRTRKVEHDKAFGHGPDAITLESARAWRAEQHALRLAGRDPVQAKRSVRRLRKLQLTDAGDYPVGSFGAIALEFYARIIEPEFKDPAQFKRILSADLLPEIGRRPVAELRLGEIQSALNAIVDRGSKVAANRALLAAKKVLRYARTQGHVEVNVLADIARRDVGGKEGERDRALSFDEITTFWRGVAGYAGLSWQVRACLLFLLLTGQRIGETLAATWGDIDLAAGSWRIPASNTKTGREHRVHLPALAVALLSTLPKPKSAAAAVFHADADQPAEPITRRAVTRALDRLLSPPRKGEPAALPLADFTPHDLRRTVRSRLADLGVLPHVAEKILNHQLGGVLQVYDRAEYLPERAEAMNKWNDKIRELVAEGDRVAFTPADVRPEAARGRD
jgi:integrase